MKTEHDLLPNEALKKTVVIVSAFLSGKCKSDFTKFYTDKGVYKYDLKEFLPIIQNAIIIDWLDNQGIFINVLLDDSNENKWKFINTRKDRSHLHDWSKCVNINSRLEATIQAIFKADEIYNLRSDSRAQAEL
jgi:hypothetical protein